MVSFQNKSKQKKKQPKRRPLLLFRGLTPTNISDVFLWKMMFTRVKPRNDCKGRRFSSFFFCSDLLLNEVVLVRTHQLLLPLHLTQLQNHYFFLLLPLRSLNHEVVLVGHISFFFLFI